MPVEIGVVVVRKIVQPVQLAANVVRRADQVVAKTMTVVEERITVVENGVAPVSQTVMLVEILKTVVRTSCKAVPKTGDALPIDRIGPRHHRSWCVDGRATRPISRAGRREGRSLIL